jgi:hypothetical protein
MADKVKESVKTGALAITDLIRGPVADPHAEFDDALGAGAVEASVGKATSDSVSNGMGVLGFEGVWCESDGKGSGAPSSSCLFYIS